MLERLAAVQLNTVAATVGDPCQPGYDNRYFFFDVGLVLLKPLAAAVAVVALACVLRYARKHARLRREGKPQDPQDAKRYRIWLYVGGIAAVVFLLIVIQQIAFPTPYAELARQLHEQGCANY